MNFLDALHISSSGLSAQRVRMNVISGNLANAHTTRTPEGGPYRRKTLIVSAQPLSRRFQDLVDSQLEGSVSEVRVEGIVSENRPPISKYNPDHPDADAKGYVQTPNINVMEEMVDMMSAARSYEANVTAATATKNMALKALEIGR